MLSKKVKYTVLTGIVALWICIVILAINNYINIYEMPYHFLFGGAIFFTLKFIKDIFTKRLSSKTVAFLGLAVILVFQYYFFSILGFAYFELVIFGTIDFALLLYLPYRLIKA